MKLLTALLTTLALVTTQPQAQNKAAVEKQFQCWLVQTIISLTKPSTPLGPGGVLE